jgi:hypothetical protein
LIRNIDTLVGRDSNRCRFGQHRAGCRTVVPNIAQRAVAGHRADQTGGTLGNLADAVVVLVCDIEIAVAVECNSKRVDSAKGRGDAVASVLIAPVAGNSADITVRGYFADSIVVVIGEIEISRRINRNAGAGADLGCRRRPAVPP